MRAGDLVFFCFFKKNQNQQTTHTFHQICIMCALFYQLGHLFYPKVNSNPQKVKSAGMKKADFPIPIKTQRLPLQTEISLISPVYPLYLQLHK